MQYWLIVLIYLISMRAVDIFCGCGGLSLGFQNAGIDVVCGIDNWDKAIAVYRRNFTHPVLKLDLSQEDVAVAAIQDYAPDMIIGGPPCQDFSSAGKRDENNGRGDLTISFARIISQVRPQWFVMENVDRIIKTQKFIDARAIFKYAGYGLTWRILDASYCGVPQKRKRFVMVGCLGKEDDFMQSAFEKSLSAQPMTIKDYLGDKIDIEYYYRHPRSYARRGIFSVNEPSPTIRGVNRPMPNGYMVHANDPVQTLDGIRPLTTKERSLIQTFPETFVFLGTKTEVEQMIGNAVPVKLGEFVANAINSYIKYQKANPPKQTNLWQTLFDFNLPQRVAVL